MTETNRNKSQGKSLFQWLVPNRRGAIWIGLFFLVAFTILQIGSIVWFGRHVRSDIGDRYYAQIKEFWQTEIVFPNEWKDAMQSDILFEEDVNRLWNVLLKIEKTNPQITKHISARFDQILNRNVGLRQVDLDEFQSLFPLFEEFYKEGMKWKQRLETTILNGPSSDALPRLYSSDWPVCTLRELIHLKAESKAAQGLFSEAVDIHLQALPLYIKSPVTQLLDYSYNLNTLRKIISKIKSAAKMVKDKERLQSWLDALTEWRRRIFRLQNERMHLYPLFNRLTVWSIPIQYGQAVNAKEYVRRMAEKQFPQTNLFFVLESMIHTGMQPIKNTKSRQPIPIEILRPLVFTNAIDDYYNIESYEINSAYDTYNNQQFVISEYDLLRLSIAAQLYALQTGRPPADSSDLVPTYFPEVINDPTTNSPYRWDENGQIIGSQQSFQ